MVAVAEVEVVVAALVVVVETGDVVVVVIGASVVLVTESVVEVDAIDVVDDTGGWVSGVAVLVPQAVSANDVMTMTMRRMAVSFLMNDDSVAVET